MNKGAERLKYIEEYYFSKKLREVKDLINNGAPIINMGIGSPDLDPPVSVCLLYTSPSPRDVEESRMPSSA